MEIINEKETNRNLETSTPQGDIPKKFSQKIVWVGPSLAVAAAAVGSGEIINATRLGAIAGLAVLWVVFWGVFLKGFIQQEIGRYSLTTKKTITQGFADIPGPKLKGKSWFLWIFIALLAIVTLVIVAGIGGAIGGVLNVLFPSLSASIWGILAMLTIIPILVVGTYTSKFSVYGIFEKIMMITVAIMTIFMLYVAFVALPLSDTYSYSMGDLLSGMTFQFPTGSTLVALAVLGSIGAGIELVFYSAWLASKGYVKHAHQSGDNASQKEERLKAWIGVLKLDTWIGVGATFIVTLAYFITGAVVLHSLGEVPSGVGVVSEISKVFTEVLGPTYFVIFLIGAFAGLYSTALGIADGSARMTGDIVQELKDKDGTNTSKTKIYRYTIVVIVLSWILFYALISAPTFLITIGAAALSLLFPLYGAALLYLNRQVPKNHRMGSLPKLALIVCFVLFTSLWFIEKLFA
jgi:manganese transport protein